MDLSKSFEFFKPGLLRERIHIIGCGSIGSTLAEILARFGIANMTLYDFDIVEAHNIANQMFIADDIGRPKTEAVADMVTRINPDARSKLKIISDGWTEKTRLDGYVFLCVDSIELRKKIAEKNLGNAYIKAMYDFRTRLTDAQHYAAVWEDAKQREDFIASMAFSDDEASEATPGSACGVALSVAPTVRNIVSYGASNFINTVQGKGIRKLIVMDAFSFTLDAF